MRNSTVLVGCLFGVGTALALIAPMYVAIPWRLLDDWSYVPVSTAMWGFVAALLVPVAAGFLGAAQDPDAAVRSGTTAGFLAAAFGWMTMALPASEVQAVETLLEVVRLGESVEGAMASAAADSLLASAWFPVVAGLMLLVMGPSLGAIGGVLYDLWAGTTGRVTRTAHRSAVPMAGLATTLACAAFVAAWTLQVDVVVLPNLGRPVDWIRRSMLSAPLVVAAVFASLYLVWAVRDALLLWKNRLRLFAAMWGGAASMLAFLVPIVFCAVYPQSMLTPVPWAVLFALGIVFLAAVIGGARSEVLLEPEARTFGEHLGQGLQVGLVTVGTALYTGFAPVAGAWVVAFPYVRALLSDAVLVQVSTEAQVRWVFQLHWGVMVAVPVLALGYVFGAGPFWLVVRAYGGRPPSGD
ncbi:MAG: hypothetical protein ABMA64_20455 [Myxococcota bacterium]